MIDDQTENSKLSNKTKNRNNLNHFILSLVLRFIIEPIISINSWGNLRLKMEKADKTK